jgi:hypothetical protein
MTHALTKNVIVEGAVSLRKIVFEKLSFVSDDKPSKNRV